MSRSILFSSFSPTGQQLVFKWPEQSSLLNFQVSFLSDILSPKSSLCDKQFHLKVDNVEFLGHPTLLHADRVGTGLKFSRICQDRKEIGSNPFQLTMFNLVIAFDSNTIKNPQEIDILYEQIILKVTAALKYEQLRRGYVQKEIELILRMKEQSNSMASIIDASSLAKTLVDIYKSVNGDRKGVIDVNSSLTLSLHTDLKMFLDLKTKGQDADGFPVLRPYLSLLLLLDPEEIISSLPHDSSPLLLQLIQIITPTQCFEELQNVLNCSIAMIYKMAAHLYIWGKARFIYPISIRNIYTISGDADLSKITLLSSQFAAKFPALELTKLLQDISSPKPLSAVIPSKEDRTLYMEAATFLLRQGWLVQLHMFIYLIIPEHICVKNGSKYSDRTIKGPIIVSDPANATHFEKECITLIAQAQPKQASDIFLRIIPYLNGLYNVEEILFRENLSRYHQLISERI